MKKSAKEFSHGLDFIVLSEGSACPYVAVNYC